MAAKFACHVQLVYVHEGSIRGAQKPIHKWSGKFDSGPKRGKSCVLLVLASRTPNWVRI